MERIVVEHEHPLGGNPVGECKRVGCRRMSPTDVGLVLVVGVLAIVNEHRRALRELESGNPVVGELGQRRAESRLVVGDVAERGGAVVDPVAERRAAVVDRLRADSGGTDLPLDRVRLAEGHERGQLADLDRCEWRRDVAGDAITQGGLGRSRTPDHDLGLRPERGREEHQTLDVVEMQMGEQDVDRLLDTGQREPEVADARAGVKDQRAAVRQRHLDAGGVAAVPHRLRARSGDRPPRAPHLDLHRASSPSTRWSSDTGQKITTAPLEPPGPTIGIVLASTSACSPPAARIR